MLLFLAFGAAEGYGSPSCDNNSESKQCRSSRAISGLAWTGTIATLTIGGLSFYLFVMACRATHNRRHMKKTFIVELDNLNRNDAA
jgi:hypothetical protein